MTDEERLRAVREALGREGHAATELVVASDPGTAGAAVHEPGIPGSRGSWFYVEDTTGIVYRMPTAAPSARAFEQRLPDGYREQLRVGKGD